MFFNGTKSFFNDKLDISLGFRMDDDSFTTNDNLFSTFSPRLSLTYEFIENWRISTTVGRYFKLPPYTILGFRDQNNRLSNQDVSYTKRSLCNWFTIHS